MIEPNAETITTNPVNYLLTALIQVGPAILIVIVGYYVARNVRAMLVRRLTPIPALDDGEVRIIANVVFWALLLITALIAMATLGFRVGNLLTFISIAAVVLVIAFQQSLSSFTATVIFYVFRVVRAGDYIETMNQEGIVEEVHMFHSTLTRPDGKLVSLPHNKMLDSGVVNRTKAGVVTAVVAFDLAYGQDMAVITERVLAWMYDDPRTLPAPPPGVTVDNITVLSVRKIALATVEWQNLNDFQFDLKEAIAEIVAQDRVDSAVKPLAAAPPPRDRDE